MHILHISLLFTICYFLDDPYYVHVDFLARHNGCACMLRLVAYRTGCGH